MRNWLTFGGKDSRDFGVYISGQGTFTAPEKAYTFYAVPGRNGALIGNERRLENIQVSYECFIYSNFKQNVADFRTYLLSLDGYQELTDAAEQRRRFDEEAGIRRALGKRAGVRDDEFLAALDSGLPECAGVALGLDRLVMLALGIDDIERVVPFVD